MDYNNGGGGIMMWGNASSYTQGPFIAAEHQPIRVLLLTICIRLQLQVIHLITVTYNRYIIRIRTVFMTEMYFERTVLLALFLFRFNGP